MLDQRILAKSPAGGRTITLDEHIRSVLQACAAMFGTPDSPTQLTQRWLRFFRLPAELGPDFLANIWLGAAFHDLGKASDGFQRAVRRRGDQYIRHEHLSGLILALEPFGNWLGTLEDRGVDAEIVMAAVVSHHLKVGPGPADFAQRLTTASHPTVRVFLDSADIASVLRLAAAPLEVEPPDLLAFARQWDFASDIDPRAAEFRHKMHRFNGELRSDEQRRRLLLAVKAAVLAADAAGSAAVRIDEDLDSWIASAFDRSPLTATDIERMVIQPRVAELESLSLWNGFHDFQLAAGNLGPRALLLAACGSGKTLAAWLWIAEQLRRRPASRVLFLYPTRATATEGFRDYVSWAGPDEATLLSGTAPFDLDGMFDNPADPRRGRDYAAEDRLFALGHWHRRVFSATVDSFLAFMAHRYAPLCLLPLLADSIVVVDEVHSFDKPMFRALERWLKFFDIPVLCMTASLPEDRIGVLRDGCGLEVFPSDSAVFAELKAQSSAPRYRVQWTEETAGLKLAIDAVQDGKRVLWVLNTVGRCQSTARALDKAGEDLPILCYHSRFRLMDRKKRHDEVISRFRSEPMLLVTTQVCEMSLDLDADLLISELAPVPSLIQRMGRCCRKPIPTPVQRGDVYLLKPPRPEPYLKREIDEGSLLAEFLTNRPIVSQDELASYLDKMEIADPFVAGGFAGFIDSGWYAMSRDESFREDDEFTLDCVLDSDADAYLAARRAGDPSADGFVLPAPRRLCRAAPLPGTYLHLAPPQSYDPTYGLLDG